MPSANFNKKLSLSLLYQRLQSFISRRVFSEFLAKLRFVARIVDNNVAKMHNSGVLKFNLVWSKKYGYK